MKWLVFNIGNDYSVVYSYNNAITIGYLLNFNVISIGMNYKLYSLEEDSELFTFESKMRLLSEFLEPKEENESVFYAIKCTKSYQKAKNKTAQQIVAYKNLSATLLNLYKKNTEYLFKKLNVIYGFETFKKILTKDNFYFNSNWGGNDKTIDAGLAISKVLQLDFPKSENENSVFIINDFINSDQEINDFIFYPSSNKEAKNLNKIYLDKFCFLPEVFRMSVTELKIAKNQLEEPTKTLLQHMDRWATLCHQNPNTTKGLTYFKKEIKPLLTSLKELPSQSTIIKNQFSKESLNTIQLFIGEAPLKTIWDLYFGAGIINEEIFRELTTLKQEQNSKLERRYPIIYIKNKKGGPSRENKSNSEIVPEEKTVVSVRKTISID